MDLEENVGVLAGIIGGVIVVAIGIALCTVCTLLVIGGNLIQF